MDSTPNSDTGLESLPPLSFLIGIILFGDTVPNCCSFTKSLVVWCFTGFMFFFVTSGLKVAGDASSKVSFALWNYFGEN